MRFVFLSLCFVLLATACSNIDVSATATSTTDTTTPQLRLTTSTIDALPLDLSPVDTTAVDGETTTTATADSVVDSEPETSLSTTTAPTPTTSVAPTPTTAKPAATTAPGVRYTDVKASLRVLLYQSSTVKADSAATTAAPGLSAVLVVDSSTSINIVSKANLAGWGISFDEAYALALKQTFAYDFGLFDPAAAITAISSGQSYGDFYKTTSILELAEFTNTASVAGYIISIPRRDEFTIVDLDRVIAEGQLPPTIVATTFAEVSVTNYKAGPNPVSAKPFWWHNGTLTPIDVVNGQAKLPADLAAILG